MNQKLFEIFNSNETPFFAQGEYFSGDEPPDYPLIRLLSLDAGQLKPFTKTILDESNPEDFKEAINKLSLGIYTFSQFQDILDITLSPDGQPEQMLNRHYCYYESLVYLRESAVAWLEANVLAALVLLRPFLELSVLHIYWYLRCQDNSYEPYYKWLSGNKGKPPFRNQFDYIFENLPTRDWLDKKRVSVLKKALERLYSASCAYNHTPKVEESVINLGAGRGVISAFGFFYYLNFTETLLRQIIHLYTLVYPLSLFPVEFYKKWGFSGFLGVFFERNNHAILAKYLGKDTTSNLQKQLASVPKVKEHLDWFNQNPDLTETEIKADWERFSKENNIKFGAEHIGQMIAYQKSYLRALGWFMNYVHTPKNIDDIPEEVFEKTEKLLKNWE